MIMICKLDRKKKLPWKVAHGLFFRNHRKLLVVDDEVGFAGGMNISNLYAGRESGGIGMGHGVLMLLRYDMIVFYPLVPQATSETHTSRWRGLQ